MLALVGRLPPRGVARLFQPLARSQIIKGTLMADKSSIEWTDATWNPTVGCSIVSPGCTHCYAMRMAARCEAMGIAHYAGTTRVVNGHTLWTGQINAAPDHILTQPLRWKRPRRIFVNSMSDLFAEGVSDETIDKVFAVMALAPQHTFQVLTKRPERMREALKGMAENHHDRLWQTGLFEWMNEDRLPWPLPNVWLGVSVEDQARADERIPILLDTPAAVRFISAEPLLGPVALTQIPSPVVTPEDEGYWHSCLERSDVHYCEGFPDVLTGREIVEAVDGPMMERLDWVIVGGESGPGARPMHPDWARQIRDDCAAAGVPFFFKQWGEHVPCLRADDGEKMVCLEDGAESLAFDDETRHPVIRTHGREFWRIGKRAAGRLLDRVEHNGMPG